MTYSISLSPCSRYVAYRPAMLTSTLEDATRRSATVMAFARKHGTRRVLLDWRGLDFPINNRFSDAVVKFRHLFPKGSWRIAMVYSVDSKPYSNQMVSSIAGMLQGIGQSAADFADYDKAVAWLLAAEDKQAA